MAASVTEVVNFALSSLGQPPLTDITTDTGVVRDECQRWFETAYKEELRAFDWPFAIVRVSIAKDATAPAFGWSTRFAVPADSIRFLPVTQTGEDDGDPINHEVEGGFILINQEADLKLRYIQDVSDVTQWPDNFTQLVAAHLALKLAENITGLSQSVQTASARYQEQFQRAHRFEERQAGTPAPAHVSGWIGDRL